MEPRRFFNSYLQTCVERDVRALIQLRDLSLFQQFLTLLAGRVGQIVNCASLGNDVGASATTIRAWISVLKASYEVFELPPFFENVQKRVIKSPKIYFTDVGLAAFLLGIHTAEQASRDPLRGDLYENLVIADIMKSALNLGIRPEVYFFRDSHGNEIDLLIRGRGMTDADSDQVRRDLFHGFRQTTRMVPNPGRQAGPARRGFLWRRAAVQCLGRPNSQSARRGRPLADADRSRGVKMRPIIGIQSSA